MPDKIKILVVDDDEHIAELISLYLIREGYETREVYTGTEAVKVFSEFSPNLIPVSYTHLDVYKRQG